MVCQSQLQKWVVSAEGGARSLSLWLEPVPAAGPKAAHRLHLHVSSFLTWVPFFGSLSTAHFRSASLHHRSICHVNWGTRGSFSFGLVYGRIPRGIQNVLTQTNGTNKSEISLATSSWLQRENGEHLAEHWPTWKTHLSGRIQHKA